MKTESIAPQRPSEGRSTSSATARSSANDPPDLFALMLADATGEAQALPTQAAKLPDAKLPDVKLPDVKQKVLATEPAAPTLLASPDAKPASGGVCEQKTPMQLAGLEWMLGLANLPNLVPHQRESVAEPGGAGSLTATVTKGRSRASNSDLLSTRALEQQEQRAWAVGLGTEPLLRNTWHGSPSAELVAAPSATLGDPVAPELSVLDGALSQQPGQEHGGGQSGQRGESMRVPLETATPAHSSSEGTAVQDSFAQALGDALGSGMEQAFNELGNHISLWAAGQTRKASLLLETGLRQALEVDVSLNGDQAQLVFRTDDAATRDAIQSHAYELLNDMLNRAGLGLESLSVGARDAGQPGSSRQGAGQGHGATELAQRQDDSATSAAALQHIKTRPGLGLSVYA